VECSGVGGLHDRTHPLVILDEPTTGLDIEARYEIWELIHVKKSGHHGSIDDSPVG